MKRTKTGIKGFDKLVEGGLPANATVLLTGTPGTAKSIFSMQFCRNGAQLYKERCLYVSFEQTKEDIYKQGEQFNWDLRKLEEKGMLYVWSVPVRDIDHQTIKKILEFIKLKKIKRLVLDSLSTLSINAPLYSAINDFFLRDLITQKEIYSPSLDFDFLLKRFIYLFIGELQELSVTSILISEIGKDSNYLSRDTISEFLCDGIIQMFFESMGGKYSRSLLVRKLRHVKNDEDIHPVELSKKGVIVHDLK